MKKRKEEAVNQNEPREAMAANPEEKRRKIIKRCIKCGAELGPADNAESQTNRHQYECMVCANLGS